MLVALQLVGAAAVPLNATVLAPCVEPKPVPVIVTVAPTGPEVGLRLVMAGVRVKGEPRLATPATVTTMLPVVAPLGTGAMTRLWFQLEGVIATPLRVTVLEPWDVPKPPPLIVTLVPMGPDVGVRLRMLGVTV